MRPLLGRDDLDLILQSGGMDDLLRRLAAHKLDVVLSNQPVRGDSEHPWHSQRLARQSVSLIASPHLSPSPVFPNGLSEHALILPGVENATRLAFNQLCSHYRLTPNIAAEVDDMAMMRLLTRDTQHIAVMPPVVVRDELQHGTLIDYGALPGVWEEFYAITIQRRFNSSALQEMLNQPQDLLLG